MINFAIEYPSALSTVTIEWKEITVGQTYQKKS